MFDRSKIAYLLLENISKFCEKLKDLGGIVLLFPGLIGSVVGVKPSNQFTPPDLFEKRGWPKQVLQCLWDLGHSCEKVAAAIIIG